MFTREELLEKGVPEDSVDEIIAGFEDGSDDSLTALSKALGNSDDYDSLFKADKEVEIEVKSGDDEDEDEDEGKDKEYMKAKKYMKANPSACKKFMKEMGYSKGEMKKAVEDIDSDSEGLVVEMADGVPVLEAISDSIESMSKAIGALQSQVEIISKNSDHTYDVMSKAARVTLEIGKAQEGELSQSTGRKGVVVSSEMSKAQEELLTNKVSSKAVHSALLKAATEGNEQAANVLCSFESNGMDLTRMNKAQGKIIHDILVTGGDK